jgi:hypothetical protein
MAIQRRSYRIPSMKDGSKSANERSRGLNAKNVASRNSVNINRKIKNRFITQRTVLGIFSLISIRFLQLLSVP